MGRSFIDELNIVYTEVDLQNPRTHIDDGRALFTDYQLNVQTNNPNFPLKKSSVRRRFSEFVWLREKLTLTSSCSALKLLPQLPDYKHFGKFKTEFILQRMQELQHFLERIVEVRCFNKNPFLHLFLQTETPIKVIDEHFGGHSKQWIRSVVVRQYRQKVREQTHQSCLVFAGLPHYHRRRLSSTGESCHSISATDSDSDARVSCSDSPSCPDLNLDEYDIISPEPAEEMYRAMSPMLYDRSVSTESLEDSCFSDHSIVSMEEAES